MAQVAILGTEGAGKTVLMAVLAWAFRHNRKGIQLVPKTAQTSQHVAKIWNCLQEGGWPPSNPEGQLRELKWDLEIDGSPSCTLRFLEISGQDFRGLFGQDEFTAVDKMPAHKQELAKHVHSSDIVCILINLGDFIGEADVSRREESQWALKAALDSIKRHPWPKRCSIVITKADQFEVVKEEVGSWKKIASRYLPYVYGAHLRDGTIPIHAVSAVGNTVVGVNSIGEPCRVPDKQLRCRGLSTLLRWIGDSAKELGCQQEALTAPEVQVPPGFGVIIQNMTARNSVAAQPVTNSLNTPQTVSVAANLIGLLKSGLKIFALFYFGILVFSMIAAAVSTLFSR